MSMATKIAPASPVGTERCRMLNATGDRCTGEVLDRVGEVKICLRHASLVMEMISNRAAAARARAVRH